MVPAASENFSLDETISGSGKKSDETHHQSRNLKIQKLVDEIVNDANSTSSSRPYDVQRKRLFGDSVEFFAADQKRSQKVLNESINPPSPKNPKIQALIDEIINDNDQKMQILPKKSVLSVDQQNTRPPLPRTVIAAVFQEIAAAGSPTPTPTEEVIAKEKLYPKESPPRTKGAMVGYSEDSDGGTSDKASTDNSSGENRKTMTSNSRMK